MKEKRLLKLLGSIDEIYSPSDFHEGMALRFQRKVEKLSG